MGMERRAEQSISWSKVSYCKEDIHPMSWEFLNRIECILRNNLMVCILYVLTDRLKKVIFLSQLRGCE